MFICYTLSISDANDESTTCDRGHHTINAIFNCIAPCGEQATLNPDEIYEFPEDMETVGGKCLIFDACNFDGDHAEFGLLAIMETSRSEMDFARKHGGKKLLAKLKKAGYYPHFNKERSAVV